MPLTWRSPNLADAARTLAPREEEEEEERWPLFGLDSAATATLWWLVSADVSLVSAAAECKGGWFRPDRPPEQSLHYKMLAEPSCSDSIREDHYKLPREIDGG